jgi:predicted nuclease with RNAse H fold
MWAGVDVGGRAKGFHVAFVDRASGAALERCRSANDCIEALRAAAPRVVAIDAPASWAPDGERSRPCERRFATTRLCGIRFTPDAAAAAARRDRYLEWIEHGLELWDACAAAGLRVIECFPTASWTAWLGPRGAHTRAAWSARGVTALIRCGMRGLDVVRNQDDRDGLAAALTARQWDERPEAVMRFGTLHVPRRGSWPLRDRTAPGDAQIGSAV